MSSTEGLKSRSKALKPLVTARISKSEEKKSMMEEFEPLSPASRLYHERSNNCVIIVIIGSKMKIDPIVFKAGIEKSLVKHSNSRFSCIQVMDKGGNINLVQTKVDLENHVYVPDLDPNMDSPDQFVEDYISNLSKTSIDMSKPLWELYILNVKTAEADALVVFKIHHSIGDGLSISSLLFACARKISDPDQLPTLPFQKISPKKSQFNWWWIFAKIWMAFLWFWNTFVDVWMSTAVIMYLKDVHTPLKGAPGVEFRQKRFVHRTVSLDDVKLVKNSMNATINDVIVGVSTAALSRYLNRRYGDGEDGTDTKINNLPKNIRITASIPVNIRGTAEIRKFAEMMENDETGIKLSNRNGYVLFPFDIALQDNPLDYVHHAKSVIDRKKQSFGPICAFLSSMLIIKFFGYKVAVALFERVFAHITVIFSNVAGPLEEISMFGYPITYIAPSVYGHPEALTLHFQSYANKMTVVLGVDEETIPDPHQLCDDIEKSLKLIKEAVISRQ
ncbi:hypothetical protein GIB67_006429 [Kingdonia uniflora]|uniref:Diacylglycerol O-acyltransferase n=1 Tax=Kingdonia uniflora TaxID=39325 RepID=A0A7J7P168_9MAGN|nr:hypothetical protein GIB67_006429 [Kingdonia uniflora]